PGRGPRTEVERARQAPPAPARPLPVPCRRVAPPRRPPHPAPSVRFAVLGLSVGPLIISRTVPASAAVDTPANSHVMAVSAVCLHRYDHIRRAQAKLGLPTFPCALRIGCPPLTVNRWRSANQRTSKPSCLTWGATFFCHQPRSVRLAGTSITISSAMSHAVHALSVNS